MDFNGNLTINEMKAAVHLYPCIYEKETHGKRYTHRRVTPVTRVAHPILSTLGVVYTFLIRQSQCTVLHTGIAKPIHIKKPIFDKRWMVYTKNLQP